jgi:hypothetical protein
MIVAPTPIPLHSRESGNPASSFLPFNLREKDSWIPAFAGMTEEETDQQRNRLT